MNRTHFGNGKTQFGFFALGIVGYAAIAVAVVVSLLMLALKVQTSRLESAQETIAAIKIQGELEEARRTKEKERSDADYKARIARLDRDSQRLRESAGKRVLPAADGSAESAITFEYSELDGALQRFIGGTTELVIEGATAIEGLDNAKRWAAER